jgi:iron complex outermembrane receptor protein
MLGQKQFAYSHTTGLRAVLLASTVVATAGLAHGQEAAGSTEPARETILVVGSQIVGAQVTDALPVTVVSEDDIAAVSASSGDELYRSIPQLGDVGFNTTRTIGGINDARGDVGSVNLRNLGTGNTLVLLNGRRMVNHPGTQTEGAVPVMTVNANAIPIAGLSRVEVLLDGASAIYGADAVAGVVNNVLKSNFNGTAIELGASAEDGVNAKEYSGQLEWGRDFNDGQSNLSLFANFLTRDPVFASEREISASGNHSGRVPAEWSSLAGSFDNNSITSAWGIFDRYTAGNITVNGVAVTNAAGQFHIQPSTLPGCLASLGNGVCIDDTSTRDTALRYNINQNATVQNGVDRLNAFLFFNHDFSNGLELFAEGGVYLAETTGYREMAPMLGAVPIVVPRTNYWNPFGPVGSPNRFAVTNAPAAGLDLVLGSLTGTAAYRVLDAGPSKFEVENLTTRLLTGLRGDVGGFDWETAVLYSEATAEDSANRISNTLFQQSLALNTPDAYNPFNGGCTDTFEDGDCTPSSQAAVDAITVIATRNSKTTLASWDAKVSRPDLFSLWAGDVGVAAGVEVRRETYSDDRDPRQDGTINFTDMVSGLTTNDLMGNSPSADISGARNVESAYVEFAVPLLRDVFLAQDVNLQLAARYEHSDTFGDVTTPKAALSWRPFDFLLFRSAWSEGFRAPNLQQQFESLVERSNTGVDYLFCHAGIGVGFGSTCSAATLPANIVASQSIVSRRSGSVNLEPERSTNMTAGFVLESTFLPEEWGTITLTADWWRIERTDVISVFGDANQLRLDYALRLMDPGNPNAGNPNVVRAGVNSLSPEELAAFTARGIAPAGHVLHVVDNYYNLDRIDTEGVDIGLYYKIDETPLGDFSFRINGANMYDQSGSPSIEGDIINAAAATGTISPQVIVNGQGQLVRRDGKPKWRYSSSLTWRNGPVGAGWYTSYVSSVMDTGLIRAADQAAFVIDDYQTHNAYVQYTLNDDTDQAMRLRFGVRNLFDETPPLADTSFGYEGSLHSGAGRSIYASVRKSF